MLSESKFSICMERQSIFNMSGGFGSSIHRILPVLQFDIPFSFTMMAARNCLLMKEMGKGNMRTGHDLFCAIKQILITVT